jgi:O-antigen/teichoic acid export membrane protein
MAFCPLMLSFTMTIYAGSEMMGNYFSAVYFSILLTFISLPISTVLFPTFSKLNVERETGLVKKILLLPLNTRLSFLCLQQWL